MDHQETSSVSTGQSSNLTRTGNDRILAQIRSGIFLIAWFIMFNTFESLTRTVINLLDTNYALDAWGRLFIAAGVAALLSFTLTSSAKFAQD